MRRVCQSVLLLFCTGMVAPSQMQTAAAPSTAVESDVAGALSHLALRAGLIFVGSVETIERTPSAVEVTLRVDQVLQGQVGSRYIMREWVGRWPPGLQRYNVGQPALFFLHAPSASGLSSPVDGADGVVPVREDPQSGTVLDVSRLNARLVRRVGEPLSTLSTLPLQAASQTIANALRPGLRRPANPSGEQPLPIARPVTHSGASNPRSAEATLESR